MTFRAFLTTILLVAVLLAFSFVVFAGRIVEMKLAQLLPAGLDPVTLGFHELLLYQAGAILVVSTVIAILGFLIVNALVISPLNAIIKAVEAFTTRSERITLKESKMSPMEIRNLATSFTSFAENIEVAHAHDVEVSRIKSDFISTAAHQLRTPLTGIRWALEALQQEQLTEGQQALVKSAVDKSHDLVGIVSTLLDISSIESGKYKYDFQPVSMQDLVAEITNDFKPLAQETQVTLEYDSAQAPLPPARGDRERIKWILNNLIENAIRYTPAGGYVRATVEQVPGRIQVLVRDTGIGIAPKDRGNIFERFYRAENAVSKENKGNGLGLYIARTIATDHGGDLNFTANAEGPGTTFTLSLPLAS